MAITRAASARSQQEAARDSLEGATRASIRKPESKQYGTPPDFESRRQHKITLARSQQGAADDSLNVSIITPIHNAASTQHESPLGSESMRPQRDSPTAVRPAAAVQTAPFFKLPGEMRNTIYRLVLLEPQQITVTAAGYSRNGGLLGTCKEIRNEAVAIFYKENKFFHAISRFDCRPFVRFKTSLPCMKYLGHCSLTMAVDASEASWGNLLLWLEAYHAKKTRRSLNSPEELIAKGNSRLPSHCLGTMFAVAGELRSMPWPAVKKIMEVSRPTLALLDSSWNDDDS